MRKRTSQPVAVLAICLMFLGPLASGLLAADTGTTTQTADPTLITKAPSTVLLAFFPFLIDFLTNASTSQTSTANDGTIITAKTTAEIHAVRLSGRD